jgi:hypothetical protein
MIKKIEEWLDLHSNMLQVILCQAIRHKGKGMPYLWIREQLPIYLFYLDREMMIKMEIESPVLPVLHIYL